MSYEHPDGAAARSLEARRQAYEGVRALLSDDHNHELGLFALKDVIDRVLQRRARQRPWHPQQVADALGFTPLGGAAAPTRTGRLSV